MTSGSSSAARINARFASTRSSGIVLSALARTRGSGSFAYAGRRRSETADAASRTRTFAHPLRSGGRSFSSKCLANPRMEIGERAGQNRERLRRGNGTEGAGDVGAGKDVRIIDEKL